MEVIYFFVLDEKWNKHHPCVGTVTVLCSASLRSFLRVILRVRSPKDPRSAATVCSQKDTWYAVLFIYCAVNCFLTR